MRKVVLLFPDTYSIADFLTEQRISNAEVNSREHSLIAVMEDEEIIRAVDDYGAHLNCEWIGVGKPLC